ncbi:phosphatidylethanolamine N-methyltransferase isoform X4 [Suricata suricatta]|uniref:phosphatidylethanolamine N-methyltransferase isoform X4 n=1 Tax=Suricata suricatta TaxID=37032 RepID=UPI0011560392|nr:phosphatidylethanolamine N-methyltransferase isoform X4 [Suricata suricatta]
MLTSGRPLRYDLAAGLRGPLGSRLCGCHPHHHFQPALLECGCEMGTQNAQAEQGLPIPLPGLLLPGRCHFAPEHPALALAMLSQPKMESLDNPTAYCLGLALLGIGSTFVLSSFFALGFTGTFLGDYFGILMEARVTTFPFNILDNPMYWGSTANYLGWAIICVLCAQMRPPKAELTCGPCLRPSGGARCPGVRCHQARQPHRPAADRGRGPHLHSRHPVRGALHRSDLPAESLPVPQEELTAPVATSLRACCPRPAPSARPCSGEKGAWPPLGVRARCGPLSALETSALGALDMPLFGHRALVSRCPQHTLTPQ